MRITDQYFWNVIFLIFFSVLFVMGAIILSTEAYLDRETLTFFDVTLITLASFRMTRFFVYDSITKFFREQFYVAKVQRGGRVELEKAKTGPRRTMADLMTCPWCFGIWSASTITFFYLLTPIAYFPTLVLAVAGMASVLQVLSNIMTGANDK
ncbi:DUF1360 domain-containing protein [Candidatus Kaiserbacteria bacterium]|nr:DUF1360 domain-containing protein [Candidatus Kaiserbacteria bacterium]